MRPESGSSFSSVFLSFTQGLPPPSWFLSPSTSDKNMPATAINIAVRHPHRSGMWRAVPMTVLPDPSARSPYPHSSNPDKIRPWHRRYNIHLRRRGGDGNFHLSPWRQGLDTAPSFKNNYRAGQNN
jgi:hypothetical protein